MPIICIYKYVTDWNMIEIMIEILYEKYNWLYILHNYIIFIYLSIKENE